MKRVIHAAARRGFDFARRFTPAQRAKRRAVEALRHRPPLPAQRARIAVYYADDSVNLYQLRQWYAPLRELSKRWPVLTVTRDAVAARAVTKESGLETMFADEVSDLDAIVEQQPLELVLYVNQHPLNFEMLRYGDRRHVFINHGESDKMFMTTNQFKAYDTALIAGDAARVRLTRALWDYDVETRTIPIGRPQVDHFGGEAPFPDDERTVVLYAPTWEGDRPAARYGSVASHGEALVARLLETGRHRVVYRPHPRSGAYDSAYGAANQRIIDALAAANERDPSAHHVYDASPSIGWQLLRPDIAVCDISAMVYDRLATGKPLMVTRPVSASAVVDEGGYLSACEWLEAGDVDGVGASPGAGASSGSDIVAVLDGMIEDRAARSRLAEWSRHYFGDTTPGAPTVRFHAAIEALIRDVTERRGNAGASDAGGAASSR